MPAFSVDEGSKKYKKNKSLIKCTVEKKYFKKSIFKPILEADCGIGNLYRHIITAA